MTDARPAEFGKRLRLAVAASDLSQKALAARLDVEPATVSKWANGHALPSGEHMVRLPAILHVNGHWLLTGDGPQHIASQDERDAVLEAIARELEKLNP